MAWGQILPPNFNPSNPESGWTDWIPLPVANTPAGGSSPYFVDLDVSDGWAGSPIQVEIRYFKDGEMTFEYHTLPQGTGSINFQVTGDGENAQYTEPAVRLRNLGPTPAGIVFEGDRDEAPINEHPDFVPPWSGGLFHSPPFDPVVLDLDNDGIELTSLESSAAYFDLDGDGFRELTGWVAPDDGFLALDANQNGIVDDITELFGSATTDGFVELTLLDTNDDQVIDDNDALFSDLKIWIDSNSDGKTDNGELYSLSYFDIDSISLSTTFSGQDVVGNTILNESSYSLSGGGSGTAASVAFEIDQLYSRYTLPTAYQEDPDAAIFPNLHGYGDVKDLLVEMSLSQTLLDEVEEFVSSTNTMNYDSFIAGFEDILFAWTGVSGISPTSRGPYVDAQHLAVLEAMHGTEFVQQIVGGTTNDPFNQQTGDAIEEQYGILLATLALRFAAQVPLAMSSLDDSSSAALAHQFLPLASVRYDPKTDHLSCDFDTLAYWLNESEYATVAEELSSLQFLGRLVRPLVLDQFVGNLEGFWDEVDDAFSAVFGDTDVAGAAARFATGAYIAEGTDGIDNLSVTSGDILFVGGLGDDSIYSTTGSDTFLYAEGDGSDLVDEEDSSTSDTDILWLTDLNPNDVELRRDGDDLFIKVLSTGHEIEIDEQYYSDGDYGYGIEEIRFADDTVWNEATIQQHAWIRGTNGADTLMGSSLDDTFVGGEGDDTLSGYYGSDIYRYASGDGEDTIAEQGYDENTDTDRLQFTDINPGDISVWRSMSDADDLYITITATGETIFVDDHFYDSAYGLEEIAFADTTVWNRATILANASIAGTAGADTFTGDSDDEIIDGRGGDDTLNGYYGSDTYLYASGDGDDTIAELGYDENTDTDRLQFTDINPGDISVWRSLSDADDLYITVTATDETIFVDDHFLDSAYGLEEIAFADTTVWNRATILANATIIGTGSADYFNGDSGDEIIYGRGGGDTLNGGDGNDYIDGEGGADDITGGNGNDTLLGDVSADWLSGDDGADDLFGGAGNDDLEGGAGDDMLYGGAGNDALEGGAGADTFVLDATPNGSNNVDTISDFEAGTDQILLSQTIFSVIGATLDASEFVTGTAAQDADDYIIYNTGNGKLYYDADGNGAGSKVQIAKLTTIPTIDQDDFLMAA